MFLRVSFRVLLGFNIGFLQGSFTVSFGFLESSTLGFFRVSFRVSLEFHVVCRLHVIYMQCIIRDVICKLQY